MAVAHVGAGRADGPGVLGISSEKYAAPGRNRPVRKAPGSTMTTWIPNGSTSARSVSERPSSANFVAQ